MVFCPRPRVQLYLSKIFSPRIQCSGHKTFTVTEQNLLIHLGKFEIKFLLIFTTQKVIDLPDLAKPLHFFCQCAQMETSMSVAV